MSRRRASLVAALLVTLAGACGGDGPTRTTTVISTTTAPAAPPAAPETEPGAPPDGAFELTTTDPAKLSGDAVPERYLPKPFPLPGPARVMKGFGKPKPSNGLFFLEIDASVGDVKRYFETEYPDQGWRKGTDEDRERNGAKGFNLLFSRENFQKSAGFIGEEREGKVLIQVQYSDNSKL